MRMRLSISAKILVAFLIILVTFGGVTVYGGIRLRHLGEALRLASSGYPELRLELNEFQTGQSTLLKIMSEQMGKPDGLLRIPRIVKFAVDDARRSRLIGQMPQAMSNLAKLDRLPAPPEERQLLDQLKKSFLEVQARFLRDEELFDQVFGPVGDPPLVRPLDQAEAIKKVGDKLLEEEHTTRRSLAHLTAQLRLGAQQSGLRLEEEEYRAVWALLALAVVAGALCILVMVIATRMLRPLRRLAEGAKRIARGEYRERVDDSARDEIGVLGHEFNAMAEALAEREQQLIRSERLAAVGKIAAQITHEVRNPLSSIGLNAEMLEEELGQLDGAAAKEAQALARAIVKEVDRLNEITEEYLRFARLPRPKLQREEAGDIVASLVAFLRMELDARRIVVELELSRLPEVAADEHQLRQALLNLLRNAMEAMPPGGRLGISARVDGEVVELRISDTGPGIAPEHLLKVFDPFFTTKDGGTGLGLALTQQIIVEHGGTISVESELGRGTLFIVRLPTLPPVASAEPELAAFRER